MCGEVPMPVRVEIEDDGVGIFEEDGLCGGWGCVAGNNENMTLKTLIRILCSIIYLLFTLLFLLFLLLKLLSYTIFTIFIGLFIYSF